MIYKKGQSVWSIKDNQIKEYVIEDIRFTSLFQLIKLEGKWKMADTFFSSLEKAMEADERNTFNMFSMK